MCTKTFTVITYGCKVNQYESQAIAESIVRKGFEWRELSDGLDAYVINTCTVTENAYKEAYDTARHLAAKNHGAKIIVTGCAVNSNEANFKEIAGVSVERSKESVAGLIAGGTETEPLKITSFEGHTRAFLKVQDGCDLNCSFCIIPQVRGANRSKSIDQTLAEARNLVKNGYREIVLTGVHLGSFGKDTEKKLQLPRLVSELLKIKDLERIRLSSIEINEVSEELITIMKNEDRFCPHLHLPLQSGDDSVLMAMRRRYNTSQFLRQIEAIKSKVHEPSFSTDIIIGFPTESDQNFENTLRFCEQVTFSRVHIFTYSHRSGTDASKLPDLPRTTKKERYSKLRGLSARMAADYYKRFVGKRVSVLVESSNGNSTGYTERYLKATIPGSCERGKIVNVSVQSIGDENLVCSQVANQNN